MKLFILTTFSIVTIVSAFTPITNASYKYVKLDMATRRDILYGVVSVVTVMDLAIVTAPQPIHALNTIPADNEIVKEQRTVVGRIDVNNAAVADYMQIPGMYPTIAGKISNNGPYGSLKDVYKLKILSKAEKSMIREHEKELTATPSTGLDTMRGRDPYRRSFNK